MRRLIAAWIFVIAPIVVSFSTSEPRPSTTSSPISTRSRTQDWSPRITRAPIRDPATMHPQIVAMFFSHCEYACPILVNDLKKIEASLPENARRGADFLLVSIDPKRDTPEALAAFRARLGLPLANWSLLRGGEDDVRELAALLGVNYAPDERGQFAHSNVITLLNAEGEVAFQQPGLRADPTLLIAAIQKAVAAAKP